MEQVENVEQLGKVLQDLRVDPTDFEPEIISSPKIHLHSISHTVVPTIMQCSMGGFIISIPGKGVGARATFQEAMDFLSQELHKECYGQGRDLPKIVRDTYEKQPMAAQVGIVMSIVSVAMTCFGFAMRMIV